MRILLVDDCDITLEYLRVCLEQEFPEVEVTEYESKTRGKPGADFDWSVYDALLLDFNLGNGETGVDWLSEFGTQPGFPPTVLITGVEDPYVVAKAIKAGADGYLNKADLSPERLAAVVREVIAEKSVHSPTQSCPWAESEGGEDPIAGFERERASKRDGDGASYRFGRLLGEGAASKVYVAERTNDGLTVAIKILDRSFAREPEFLQRFIQEGQLLTELDSPFVVKVYEQGFTNSYGYIAMEFFGRGDLRQRIQLGIARDNALVYLYNIACGLTAIHQVGIVHRDLKPANVMFRADDSMALADFGISKRFGGDLDLTRAGTIMGTPHYMSPEQARGEAADPRSDLYSAGIILYEILTGSKPFGGETSSTVMFQHMHAAIPELEGDNTRFQPVLNRLLAKDPDDRFQDVLELRQTLARMGASA